MTAMTIATGLPFGRPLTVADLETLPDDGHRYELLDGTLLVTPAPGWDHQEMAGKSYRWLCDACPPELRVIIAPFAVQMAIDTELQPDVLVARYSDLTLKNLPVPPLLVIEVRSPSTALVDRNLKRAAYARFGIPSYWLLDPRKPSITVLELSGDDYVEVGHAVGAKSVTVERPFPITLTPRDLVRGLEPG